MSTPLLSIYDASISYAKKVIFEDLNLNLFDRDRICLIGKNGAGKSSLMNVVAGKLQLDAGTRWVSGNCVVGYLEQNEEMPQNMTIVDYIMGSLQLDDHKSYLVDIICENLQLDKNLMTDNLSGGQKRRAHLAKSLVLEPEILLLDEPTNHLDLSIIEWLEGYLNNYKGALLVISHDRKFLEKISNKVFWLRAGVLKVNNEGYKNFDEWSNYIIEHEKRELRNLEKKVELESGWLQTGVTGRRKRNIGRLHFLQDLRQKLQQQKKLVFANQNKMKIIDQNDYDKDAPQVIASFNNVSKSYVEKKLIDKFTLKILRGEKIGIIGNNGTGKSTFLKLLIDEIEADGGTVKRARDLQFSYFDQQRSAMKPNLTIQEFLCETGSDYINLGGGKTRHICSYIQDFLFDPTDNNTLVSTLSGGQQNRLLLAKTLADPKNFLILDEPTNDLDMDALDMLEEYLVNYQGTLLIVSHDRDFLDNVATSILAFEGNGVITSHLGGYSDYIEYVEKNKVEEIETQARSKRAKEIIEEVPQIKAEKFSNKHHHELGKIPGKIEELEKKMHILSQELSETEDRNPANLAHISMEISKLQNKIDELEARWIELEDLKKNQ